MFIVSIYKCSCFCMFVSGYFAQFIIFFVDSLVISYISYVNRNNLFCFLWSWIPFIYFFSCLIHLSWTLNTMFNIKSETWYPFLLPDLKGESAFTVDYELFIYDHYWDFFFSLVCRIYRETLWIFQMLFIKRDNCVGFFPT